MDFQDALQRSAPLDRVGPLRLRYEPSLLIGEPMGRNPRGTQALLMRLVALALGMLAIALVLSAAMNARLPWTALGTAVLSAALFGASAMIERAFSARRFILNFGTESLRLDDLPTALKRPRTRTVHFDQIASVDVEAEPRTHSFALWITLKAEAGNPTRERLIAGVSGEDVEDLRRLWRVLRDAFGLSRKEPEGA